MSGGGSRSRDGDSRSGDRRGYDSPGDSYDDGMYDRFRDRDGREHYDNGRFAPMRSEYGGAQMHYMPYPYVPPIYQGQDRERMEPRQEYSSRGGSRPMNKIGFSLEGEMDKLPPREFDQDYRMNELAYRKGGERMNGYSAGAGYIPFTREIAEAWTSHMENEDGTRGPHWSMEQTKQVQAQRGIECDPLEFWVAINMIYSDYCKAAKKANANTIDFYADMAKAFLDDKDAPKDKLARYYAYIVEAKE